ncbi:hypothetical protein A2U01_0042485, partial [Trifolium medium]|nr:hypothetical protein [Trifolium medium]
MDSSSIVNAVLKRKYNRSYWGRIARRCGGIIDRSPRISIGWVRRTSNTAAHTLANWAIVEPNKTWTDDVPV